MTPFKKTSLWLALGGAVLAARAQPIDVSDHKQLFIDDKFVAESSGVALHMNPPEKRGLVLGGTESWDDYSLSSYGTVMEDQGKYRLWYGARSPATPIVDRARGRIMYAESEDGIHWRKPHLGLIEWNGSKANNIVMVATPESAGVVIDAKAPPNERYKIVGRLADKSPRSPDGEAPDGAGLYMYTSPDGLKWTLHPKKVFPFDPDTLNMALYDQRTNKFLAYVRTWNPLRRVGVVEVTDLMQPWPYDKSVPPRDPKGLAGPTNAPTSNIPDAFGTDKDDQPGTDFYTSSTVEYPWADDAYFMFPSAYRHYPEPPAGPFHNGGVLDTELAVSRDGRKFHRVSRLPYIGLGREGSLDSKGTYVLIGMLRRDGQIYQYYGGHDREHGDIRPAVGVKHEGGLFLTVQRLDGFVSLDAGPAGGSFTTPVLTFQGSKLDLNMDASALGEIRVEIQGQDGKALKGFAFADSDALGLNDLSKTATWRKGSSDVSTLAGKPVRLAFRLRAAKLYAFQFGR
jgi:hypothetical protein